MRVLLVTEASGGGSGRHIVDLGRGLKKNGHQVSVIYSSSRAEDRFVSEIEEGDFDCVVDLPMDRSVGLRDLYSAVQLRAIIKTMGPFDIIHAHSSKAGALARLVAPSMSTRVYTPHAFRTMDPTMGKLGHLVYGGIEGLLGRLITDSVIAVAPEEFDHAKRLGIPESKLHTVVNGVARGEGADRSEIRLDLGVAPEHIVVGFVGRLVEQKDPIRFATAISIASKINPLIRGVVLGDGPLVDEVRAAGGSALQIFKGRDAKKYMPGFDLLTMTSRYEAMPYVLLEAVQAGLPIISSEVSGTSVTVRHQENGRIVPVDASPDVFADVILDVINKKILQEYSRSSLEISRKFTIEKMVSETEDVYSKSMARRRRA